eukprot:superscaffoldBa00011715_g25337
MTSQRSDLDLLGVAERDLLGEDLDLDVMTSSAEPGWTRGGSLRTSGTWLTSSLGSGCDSCCGSNASPETWTETWTWTQTRTRRAAVREDRCGVINYSWQ